MFAEEDDFEPTFVDEIGAEKLKQLIFIIRDMSDRDKPKTNKEIADFLSLTEEQVCLIKEHPDYLGCIHEMIKSDADVIKTALRSQSVIATEKLAGLVQEGDLDAIKLLFKVLGADKPKEDAKLTGVQLMIQWLEKIGLAPRDVENARKIEQARKVEEERKLLEEKVVDADYEVLDEPPVEEDVDEFLLDSIPEADDPIEG